MAKHRYEWHGTPIELEARPSNGGWVITLPDGVQHTVEVSIHSVPGVLTLSVGDRRWRVAYFTTPEAIHLMWQGRLYRFRRAQAGQGSGTHTASEGILTAPMPGLVSKVWVQVGDEVESGQRLLVLEAMKTEQALRAPFAGTVRQLNVREGEIVQEGTILVEIEPTT